MTTPMETQPKVVLPSLVGATEPVADPAMEEQNRRREKAKQDALDRYHQKQAKKDADHQQEWLLRQKEKRKDVCVLPDTSVLRSRLEENKQVIAKIAQEIKESDIRVVTPYHPGYSRDLSLARKYEAGKEGEKAPEEEFVELFDDLVKNYAEALARFRALNWLPDEDLVFVASRETNELRHDNKDDLEDLIALINYVSPEQSFHVWFQDFKRDLDNVYFMRTGTDTLLRQWMRTKKEREDLSSAVAAETSEEEQKRMKLFDKVKQCFEEQGVEVPDAYKYKTAEEASKSNRFGFVDFGDELDKVKEEQKQDIASKKAGEVLVKAGEPVAVK